MLFLFCAQSSTWAAVLWSSWRQVTWLTSNIITTEVREVMQQWWLLQIEVNTANSGRTEKYENVFSLSPKWGLTLNSSTENSLSKALVLCSNCVSTWIRPCPTCPSKPVYWQLIMDRYLVWIWLPFCCGTVPQPLQPQDHHVHYGPNTFYSWLPCALVAAALPQLAKWAKMIWTKAGFIWPTAARWQPDQPTPSCNWGKSCLWLPGIFRISLHSTFNWAFFYFLTYWWYPPSSPSDRTTLCGTTKVSCVNL